MRGQIKGQLNIFMFLMQEPPKYRKAPRYPLSHYNLTKADIKRFDKMIRSGGIYYSLASQAAHTAVPDIAEYILLSVTKNLSYEGLQTLWELKEIERMACCRTDFYGYRRYFYHLFDLELRRIGK